MLTFYFPACVMLVISVSVTRIRVVISGGISTVGLPNVTWPAYVKYNQLNSYNIVIANSPQNYMKSFQQSIEAFC